ncbi:glycosyl hydrolase family 67 [Marinimicrobium koreense]|uniref:Glycosyl hydrolase family 67 n=1 Tax=Marinimicrobium koreense TaxID=306545 RepID=A0A3N1P0L2_9GAMM|nr:glycosyl hydrolase 115 family protein [Marinimicrobium koreense]ROQ18416.1 glycosyl hydrolase family 67 [Marinimicrobium koreense]
MLITRTLAGTLLGGLLATAPAALALEGPDYVSHSPSAGALSLVGKEHIANLYVDPSDDPGVRRAVRDLQADIQRVTGKQPQIVRSAEGLGSHGVIIGTLSGSSLIQQLVEAGKLDVSPIEGEWDAYHMEVVENPLPGLDKALVIAGANKRGAIYGTYDVSEEIGVSPWYWFADVPAQQHDHLYIDGHLNLQDQPKVKYRGIFINDEAPALTSWVQENYGDYNHDFYEHVFELILRLKGNFLWPAMWNNAFADDDEQNMILADEYGIVMSTSHHEPMMRADKEWNRYGEGPWEYSTNPDNLYEFWVDGAERNKPYESVYTLGMRGQADTPMSEGQNIELLERIVDDQREILKNVFDDRPIEDVPQVWTLYKEVQYFYEKGMRVPDDVTLLWADDNWGNIRRLPTPEERDRSGGAGVYYHFDYVGGPRSYRWINVTPIAKVWEQMNLAWEYEADRIWIVNVGDIKPMEYPTEFFLRMAWDPEYWNRERLPEFGRLWAEREFGAEFAEPIAELVTGYTRHNGRRKPEQQSADTYSLLNYREAERIEQELAALTEQADAIYAQLPEARRDAFDQLVRHLVRASANVTRMYIDQARNQLFAEQGRANANKYGQLARERFRHDAELEDHYHTEISDGKWNHMMSQPRIGYTHWNNPPENTAPLIYDYQPHSKPDMGVAVEGMEKAWPVPGAYTLPTFSPYGTKSHRIEVFNKGTAPFDFSAEPSDEWIQVSQREGTVNELVTLEVSIDWDQAPAGSHQGHVFVKGTGWGGARVQVETFKPAPRVARQVKGFVEANGYVSIEAGNFHRKQDRSGHRWEVIPQHGRTQSSISTFPISDTEFEDPAESPYVEYDIYFFSTGEFDVHGLFAPSLNLVPGRGLRYAIAFDDAEPQVVDILEDLSSEAWETAVSDGVRRSVSTHTIREPGLHTLRIYRVDPAVTLQKLMIDTGGLKPSYLGPPQSERR